jgi:PAS domain S-box-containing protein
MESRLDASRVAPALDFHLAIDAIPGLAWSSRSDGSIEFVNQRWCDYTGLSPEESYGWGWKVAVHAQDLPALEERWESSHDSEERHECEIRLRRSDGVFHWFLFRRQPHRNETGAVVRWYGTGIDIEDAKQRELLRAAEKRTLEMIADGASLADVLNDLCAAIDQHTSATTAVFLTDKDRAQLLPIAGPHLPPAVASVFTPWPIGPNRGAAH